MLWREYLGLLARAAFRPQILHCPRWRLYLCRRQSGSASINGAQGSSTGDVAGSSSSRDGRPLPHMTLGTVTTNAPSQTTIDHMLEAIRPDALSALQGGASTNARPLLALLLTPSFAQHALDHELPLKVTERIRGAGTRSGSLNAFTAVIDRLPAIGSKRAGGEEGLAYLLTSESLEAFNNQARHSPNTRNIANPRDKPGILTFAFSGANGDQRPEASLELPLAHTIFSTGRVSTLLHTRYETDANAQLQILAQSEIKSKTVPLALGSDDTTKIHLPLVPLTPARKVKHSVGNVLRKISAPAEAGEDGTQPASQELERAVSDYFEARNMDAQTVGVWALVTPKSFQGKDIGDVAFSKLVSELDDLPATALLSMQSDEIRSSWAAPDDPAGQDSLQSLINLGIRALVERGARLCKVLSGGGGWGKKAGLLSLDPETSYSEEWRGASHQEGIPAFATPQTSLGRESPLQEQDTVDTLGRIAEKDDSIMFFLATASLQNTDERPGTVTDLAEGPSAATEASPMFVFGSLPSSIDTMPVAENALIKPVITHTPNVFGMLSEGGMAFTTAVPGDGSDAIKTKLDVPYAEFTIKREQGPGLPPSRDSGHISSSNAIPTSPDPKVDAETHPKPQASAVSSQHDSHLTEPDTTTPSSADPSPTSPPHESPDLSSLSRSWRVHPRTDHTSNSFSFRSPVIRPFPYVSSATEPTQSAIRTFPIAGEVHEPTTSIIRHRHTIIPETTTGEIPKPEAQVFRYRRTTFPEDTSKIPKPVIRYPRVDFFLDTVEMFPRTKGALIRYPRVDHPVNTVEMFPPITPVSRPLLSSPSPAPAVSLPPSESNFVFQPPSKRRRRARRRHAALKQDASAQEFQKKMTAAQTDWGATPTSLARAVAVKPRVHDLRPRPLIRQAALGKARARMGAWADAMDEDEGRMSQSTDGLDRLMQASSAKRVPRRRLGRAKRSALVESVQKWLRAQRRDGDPW